MSMPTMRPCPFCGDRNPTLLYVDEDCALVGLCKACGSRGPDGRSGKRDETKLYQAEREWNQRTGIPDPTWRNSCAE